MTKLSFKITEGAKLTGNFELKESEIKVLKNEGADIGNIIVELKNEFEEYRITTNQNGGFSFPLLRPGNWTFRIYEHSIPRGYEIEKSIYSFDFNPGEKIDLVIGLESKKKKIIFKSTENTMTPLTPGKINSTSAGKKQKPKLQAITDSRYYSVQIGAFRRKLSSDSRYFEKAEFDFVKQIDNLHKYFKGKFKSIEAAKQEKERMKKYFRNPFIVIIQNNQVIPWEGNE